MFNLNERLEKDTFAVCDLSLCTVRLMNDCTYPWLILIPMLNDLSEFHQIPTEYQNDLLSDITTASQVIESLYHPDKLNVGALGNIVKQLHIHIIGRFETDPAWPGPVWGHGPTQPYSDKKTLGELQNAFARLQSSH